MNVHYPQNCHRSVIKSNRGSNNNLPFILLITANRTPDQHLQYIKQGVDQCIEKQYCPEALLPAVHSFSRIATSHTINKSEEKYRGLFENTGTATIFFNEQRIITDCNKNFERLSGYSREKIIGKKKWSDFVDRQDLQRMARYHQQRLSGKEAPNEYEFRFVDRHKNIRYIFVRVGVINRKSGQRVASLMDITGFKRSYKQLEYIQDIYRQTIENADGLPYRLTYRDNKYEFIGKECEALLGVTAEALTFQKMRDITREIVVRDPDITNDPYEYNRLFKEGKLERYRVDLRLILPNNEEKWLSDSSVPLWDDEHKSVIGSLGILQDITDRVYAQKKLEENERFISTLLSNLPGMVFRFRNDERLTAEFVSEGCKEVTGYKHADFTTGDNINYNNLIISEDRDSVFQDRQNALKSKHTYRISYRIRNARNQIRYVMETGRGVYTQTHRESPVSIEGFITDITERRKAEEALKRSEARWRYALEGNGEGVWEYDLENDRIFRSKRFKEILGFEEDELPDSIDDLVDLIHPNDRDSFLKARQENIEGVHINFSHEYRARCKNGYYKWILDRGKVMDWKADGSPARIIGTQADITSRKKAEMALKESERRYRALVESSPVSILIHTGGTITFLNTKAIKTLAGQSSLDFLGKQLSQIIHPNYIHEWQHRENRSDKSETTYHSKEIKFVRMDGHVINVEVMETRINYRGQSAAQMVFNDISERKHAEDALARLASVVDQASEAVIITDLKGVIEYVNPAFEMTTGYSKEEVVGQKPSILKSGRHPKEYYQQLWKTVRAGHSWSGQFINQKKDGTLFYEDAAIFPIKDSRGSFINFAAVKRDVTNERKLQEQLNQAQKLESIGQLAGGIAHDFNNILTVINGYAELLVNKIDETDARFKHIHQIQQAGHRASKLVSQLLAFSRKQVNDPKLLNLNHLITDLDGMLSRIIGEDIDLNYSLQEDINEIMADPAQMEQILINLIINARDAINQKSQKAANKKITIETDQIFIDENKSKNIIGLRKNDYVCLSITDTGIGMDEATRRKIFEPFFTTKGKEEGTGLGLATVYGIVKQNGGHIEVYSEPRQGTRFKIYWPSVVNIQEEKKDRPSLNEIVGGSEPILVVEDEDSVRDFICSALEQMGYQIISSNNGKEALKIIKKSKEKPALIITDIVMPEMDGFELAKQVKKLKIDTPILFSSGYSDKHMRHKGNLSKEQNNFINKPYSLQQLSQKVRQILDTTRVSD